MLLINSLSITIHVDLFFWNFWGTVHALTSGLYFIGYICRPLHQTWYTNTFFFIPYASKIPFYRVDKIIFCVICTHKHGNSLQSTLYRPYFYFASCFRVYKYMLLFQLIKKTVFSPLKLNVFYLTKTEVRMQGLFNFSAYLRPTLKICTRPTIAHFHSPWKAPNILQIYRQQRIV